MTVTEGASVTKLPPCSAAHYVFLHLSTAVLRTNANTNETLPLRYRAEYERLLFYTEPLNNSLESFLVRAGLCHLVLCHLVLCHLPLSVCASLMPAPEPTRSPRFAGSTLNKSCPFPQRSFCFQVPCPTCIPLVSAV